MGTCWRRAPFETTWKTSFCGEWADASITPEQEEMRELVRRFAVAMISAGMPIDDTTWNEAAKFAAAEPQIQREDGK
jgi:hypothetical protein